MLWALSLSLFLGLHVLVAVRGHGRLWEPPSRSSMWRLGYNTTINTDDNELSCGGFTNQWVHFGGKCGICGDPFQQNPRENEYGGKYASGLITRTYPIGGVMDVVVDLTANHEGYFEFRLCPADEFTGADPVTCSEKNRLKIINGESGGYRYYVRDPTLDGHISIQVALPEHFTCKHCLFQWKYRTATRWGCDSELRCEKGIGPQEEFYGCSDISVENVSSTVFRDPLYFLNYEKAFTSPASPEPKEFGSIHDTNEYLNYSGKRSGKKTFDPSYSKNRVSKLTKTGDSFTKYLHEIIMDAVLKHHGNGVRSIQSALADCKAASIFAKNPIVNEWCHRTCPQHQEMCQSHMCVCKTRVKDSPRRTLGKLQYTLTNGKEETQVFKSLGMSKKQFVSFVQRVLKTYRRAKNKKVIQPAIHVTKSFSKFVTKPDQLVIQKDMFKIPKRRKIFFIDFPNKKDLLRSSTQSSDILLPAKPKQTIKRMLPTISDLDPKVEDHRNLSNNIFGLRGRKIATCVASKEFAHNKYMTKWCIRNCSFGFCPKSVCACA